MKKRLLPLLLFLFAAGEGFSQGSYSIVLNPGYNLIANQLDTGSNTLNEVLTNVPDQSVLYKYVSAQGFQPPQTFKSGSGWLDQEGFPSAVTLSPGEGAFFYNPNSNSYVLAFNGVPHTNSAAITPVCGTLYLLSRPTNDVGTFENITGNSPSDGAQMLFLNNPTIITPVQSPYYTAYTFSGGAWFPGVPQVPVGEAVFIMEPCLSNSCLSVQCPEDILINAYTNLPVTVTYSPVARDTCNTNQVTVVCSPPSGSQFMPGTTPVHVVAVDDFGNAAVCDFNVTVAPPAPGFSLSYHLSIQPGTNLIANQLDHGGNTLGEIMPVMPDGCIASKYVNSTGVWLQSKYRASLGAWVPANIVLNPGDGLVLVSPTNFTLTLVGNPNTPVLPRVVPNGSTYLVSRQTNDIGTYENVTGTNPVTGTHIYKFSSTAQTFTLYAYTATGWIGGIEPTFGVGEAVWIAAPGGAGPPPVPIAPAIVSQSSSTQLPIGGSTNLTVTATGSVPLFYQWLLNGGDIPGATNSTLALAKVVPTNSGNYSAIVYNSVGTADSVPINITLNNLAALPFGKSFASAGSLGNASSGVGSANNTGATPDPGAPSPGGIPGGSPIWFEWTGTGNGIVTFSTAGSAFDTLLAVYTGTSVTSLTPVVFDDDSANFQCSSVSFNVTARTNYFIQVDGFYGTTGNVVLTWAFQSTTNQYPVFLKQPTNQTVAPGANVVLTATVNPPVAAYQWTFNGAILFGATSAVLNIPSIATPEVGVYRLMVTDSAQLTATSFPANVQIQVVSSGQSVNPLVRAEDKFRSDTDTTINPQNPYDPAPSAGYTGSQIFGTAAATTDPGEPDHCGYPPCATQWGYYLTPPGGNGLLTMDTKGSAFNAVLEVYIGPGDSFLTLTNVACSANHGAAAGESVTFSATANTQYWFVVGGVACAAGATKLNYNFMAAPAFTLLPVGQTQTNGVNVNLTATATGAPPLSYQWQLNGVNIANATGSSFTITNLEAGNQGNYQVVATNLYGTNTSPAASVYLNHPARFVNTTNFNGLFYSQLVGIAHSNYVMQTATGWNPAVTNYGSWTSLGTSNATLGLINFYDALNLNTPNRVYRSMAH